MRPAPNRFPGLAGPTSPFREPTLAETTTLIFCIAAPDARLLIGAERVLEALFLGRALSTDGLGIGDRLQSRSCRTDREEKGRFRVPAGGELTPIGGYGEQDTISLEKDCDVIHKNPTHRKNLQQGIMGWNSLEFPWGRIEGCDSSTRTTRLQE